MVDTVRTAINCKVEELELARSAADALLSILTSGNEKRAALPCPLVLFSKDCKEVDILV